MIPLFRNYPNFVLTLFLPYTLTCFHTFFRNNYPLIFLNNLFIVSA